MSIRTGVGIFVAVAIVAVSGYIAVPSSYVRSLVGYDEVKAYQPAGVSNETTLAVESTKPSEVAVLPREKEMTGTPTTSNDMNIHPSTKPSPTPVTPPPAPTPTPTPVPTPVPQPTPKPSGYSASQVAVHDSVSSCWSIIDGAVYDLTAYVTRHPGGKNKILDICGRDGTSSFQGQHEGERKPATILASYKIGDYIK